jgi:hypothetical protein
MTITVARKLIQGRASMSEPGALALAFIDGGPQWLSWASGEAASTYAFADEGEMLTQVQQGLHQSPLTLLPALKLLISPLKLMSLGIDDLRVLGKAEAGATDPETAAADAVTAQQVRTVMTAHNLATRDDLAAVDQFLTDIGIGGAAILQCLSLEDRKDLLELVSLPPMTEPDAANTMGAEAAAFAVDLARTPREFADYFRAYLAYAAKPKTAAKTADQRRQSAYGAVQTLLPLMFAALDCPQVSGIVAPGIVATAVADWLRQGRRIGFSRVSEGVCRIIDSTTFTTETGTAAQTVVNLYLANSMSFLAANPPTRGRMSQDGASCLFPIQSGNLYAELRLDGTGGITLRQFRRLTDADQDA